jgi:inner membrane protein
MFRSLFGKLAVIAGLMLLLLVPLEMVSGLVGERREQNAMVQTNIQESTSGPQRITGPVLVIPYRVHHVTKEKVKVPEEVMVVVQEDGQTREKPMIKVVWKEVTKESYSDHTVAVLPETLRIEGKAATTTLYRGIYEALTFAADTRLSGTFQLDVVALTRDPNATFGEPYVAVGVGDVRGIRNAPVLQWQGRDIAVEPGNAYASLGEGVHAPLAGLDLKAKGNYTFSLTLKLLGTASLHFTPLGKDTRVTLGADWPHPSFTGRFLPAQRQVRDDGFRAEWQTSWFATNMDREFGQRDLASVHAQDFGVAFIQPVDTYLQAERVTKYAVLFVLLTFTVFFLFEVLKHLRIHPMQYLLVGAALAMFYLLVIALSEHIEFAVAYASASAACVCLIGFYLAHVLQHWRRGFGVGALLGVLYATLFGLVQSEDNALLLGALLLFAMLAGLMVLTRRLDWYRVGRDVAQGEA